MRGRPFLILAIVAALCGPAEGGRGAYEFSAAPGASIDFGPGSAAFLDGADRFTICFPIRRVTSAAGVDDPLLAIGDGVRLAMVGSGPDQNRVRVCVQAGSDLEAVATGPLNADRWVFVAIVYDGKRSDDGIRVFLDGAPREMTPSGPGGSLARQAGSFVIGTDQSGAESAPARLGAVSIWMDVLSDDDIAELAIGKDPLLVRPDALVRHVPLTADGKGEIHDVISGTAATVNAATPASDDYVQSPHTGSSRTIPSSLPRMYANDPKAWTQRFAAAQTSTVRIAIFGDSQETRPGGAGNIMIGRLAYRLHELVGNTPQTALLSSGVTDPWYWNGWRGNQFQGSQPVEIPAVDPAGVLTRSWNQAGVAGQPYPFLARLVWQAENEREVVEAPRKVYFDMSGGVVADVFVRARPGSDGVRVREALAPYAIGNGYFETVTATHVFSATTEDVNGRVLDTDADPLVPRQFTTPPLVLGDALFPQIYVDAAHADAATIDLVGVRFRSLGNPAGFVIDSFSDGGYTAGAHVGIHNQSGPLLAIQGYQLAMIMTGVNDVPNGQARFRQDIVALIDFIRAAIGDPSFPIVLISEAARTNLLELPDGAARFAQQNAYPQRLLELAQSDDNLLFVNMRRVLEEDLQWIVRRTPDEPIETSIDAYLHDSVHYTPAGAIVLADALVDELVPNNWAPCRADVTGPQGGLRDGSVDALDFLMMISEWGSPCGYCAPDVTGPDGVRDGNIDSLDFLVLVSEWGGPCEPCSTDVTGPANEPDGIVDSLDFLRMIGEWGSPCRPLCFADITGPSNTPDGNTDALDLLLLISEWGSPGVCTD